MVPLPLDPDIDFTARVFAEKLGATTVISFDTTKDKFIPFVTREGVKERAFQLIRDFALASSAFYKIFS
jgi:hypothetical protein